MAGHWRDSDICRDSRLYALFFLSQFSTFKSLDNDFEWALYNYEWIKKTNNDEKEKNKKYEIEVENCTCSFDFNGIQNNVIGYSRMLSVCYVLYHRIIKI